jgi:hypothetical protein
MEPDPTRPSEAPRRCEGSPRPVSLKDRLGYQHFTASLLTSPRPPDAPLLRRLTFKRGCAAARLNGATRVRFSFGLPTLHGFASCIAASSGRSPLKAAYLQARLRRGAPHRRDTSSIFVWATRFNRFVRREASAGRELPFPSSDRRRVGRIAAARRPRRGSKSFAVRSLD